MDYKNLSETLAANITNGELPLSAIIKYIPETYTLSRPYAESLNLPLKNAKVDIDGTDKITITGTLQWTAQLALTFNISLQNSNNGRVASISASMPAQHELSIPGLSWFKLQNAEIILESIPLNSPGAILTPGYTHKLQCDLVLDALQFPLRATYAGQRSFTLELGLDAVSFNGISDMLRLVGGGGNLALPEQLDALGAISLHSLELEFGTGPSKTNTLNRIGLGFGTSKAWELIPGVFTLDTIVVNAQLYNPLNKQRVFGGGISGNLKLGNTEIQLSAVKAGMKEPWVFTSLIPKIGFRDLTEQALREFSLNADLPAIDFVDTSFTVTPSTGDYSFDSQSASDTNWKIPLGMTTLDITALKLSVLKQNKKLTGSIVGSAELFGASVTVTVELGDPLKLTIQAKQVSITRIFKDLTPGLGLPGNMPDLLFDQVEIQATPSSKEFSLTASASKTAKGLLVSLPLPVSGKAPSIQAKFDHISLTKSSADEEFVAAVSVQFKGFKGVLDEVIPDTSEATITINSKSQTLTITHLTDGIQISLPAIPVPGKKDVSLGKMLFNLSNFSVDLGANPGLSVDLDIGLPSQLNNIFGSSQGKSNVELFRTYDPTNPQDSVVKARVTADGKKLLVQLLSSPLKAITTFTKDGKAWWDIDMGAFGAANIMVPELSHTNASAGLSASGGFEITRPLSIPLSPLKWFLQSVFSNKVASVVPDAVPLQEINIINDKDQLNVDEFKKLWGGHFPSEIDEVLNVINDGIHKLPDRLKSYFNIKIPKSLLFDIQVDSSGGIQGSLSVNKNDPPLRILYPSMAGPLPALCGIELRKVSFGEILSGQLFTLELDATFDQFNILTIAASLAMPDSDLKILPKSQNLQSTVEIKNLFALIFYQAGIPIPVPLFYDLIGIDYLGFEGLGIGSHFKFPKPTLDMAELANILSQFVEFFTDPKFLLDTKNSPKNTDLKFTIGGNYLQLPDYTGGKLLGKKTNIDVISAWKLLAHALNWLKTFSVNEFIQSFPLDYRVGNENINFFNVAGINIAWALTTPHEFVTVAYKRLKISAQDTSGVLAVLPKQAKKQEEGLVLLMRGGFNIAKTVAFQSTFGIMGSSAQGFATGFQHKGNIANFVSAELSGAIALNPKSQPTFQLIGTTKLTVLQQTVMSGKLYLSNQELYISGLIDLFPGIKTISARANIQGIISSKQLSLTGDTNFSFGKISIIKGKLILNHKELYISGKFLDLETSLQISQVKQELNIDGNITSQIKFEVKTGAIHIAGVKVADGISFGVNAKLGLDIKVNSEAFALAVQASFKLNTKGFDVSLTLHVVPKQMADVTKELTAAIIKDIEKYFKALYADATAWIEGVASGAISFADNTANNAARVFKGAYAATAQQATQLLKSAGHTVDDIGGALKDVYQQTGQEVAAILKGAGYAADEVGKALSSAFSATADQAAAMLKGAGYTAEQVGQALQTAFNQSAQEAAQALRDAGYAADEVGKTLQSVYKQGTKQVAIVLKDAGYTANQVGKALQSAFKQTAQQTANILKGAGYTANQVGLALKSTYKLTAQQAAKTLKQAGYLASDVGKALKSAFNTSANVAASALKSAGYTANQVGAALKDGFALGANQAAKALKTAGYAVNQVGDAIKGTFTNSASAAANALKYAGYSASQTAGVMKNVFNASANDVAAALKSTYGLGSNAVSSVLKQVKFSASAISGVMKDIFHILPHVKIPHIKHVKLPHIKHIKFW